MEHAALPGAARALRKRLAAQTTSSLLLVPPGIKAAIPEIMHVLEGVEDLADRVTLLERALASHAESIVA